MTGRISPRSLRRSQVLFLRHWSNPRASALHLMSEPEILGVLFFRLVSLYGSFVFTITYVGTAATHTSSCSILSYTSLTNFLTSRRLYQHCWMHTLPSDSTQPAPFFTSHSTSALASISPSTYPTRPTYTMSHNSDSYYGVGNSGMITPSCEGCGCTLCQCNHVS